MSETRKRDSLLGIIGGLMLADNLGDVHDEINFLCDLVGIERPDGGFMDGWTDDDFLRVGIEPDREGGGVADKDKEENRRGIRD